MGGDKENKEKGEWRNKRTSPGAYLVNSLLMVSNRAARGLEYQ
jgi:hypothetical protein